METDRHPFDGEHAPDAADGTPGISYEYGDAPLRPDRPAVAAEPLGRAPASGHAPASEGASATSPHTLTAPRAVLRPVPEGFPTPPPRPARPNRRPAPPSEPAPAPQRPRSLLIAGIALTAVLALAVVVGGGILVFRSLSPAGPPAADPAAAPSDGSAEPAEPGRVEIGGATFTEVGTEVGVRSVGSQSSPVEPEGEFVIVTFEVENPSSAAIEVSQNLSLETDDGAHAPDREATQAHVADSSRYGLVPPDGSGVFHAVFDVPFGTQPTGLHLDLAAAGEGGTLPLTP